MRNKDKSPAAFFTVGIITLFLSGFLMLVVLGANSYRDAVVGQNTNMQSRALLSYISTCVKSGDAAGAVRVEDSDFGKTLVIADESSYALRIYHNDGKLLEEYSKIDSSLSPERARTIGETEVFELSREDEVIRVRTDAGEIIVAVRSDSGVAR